MTTLADGTEHAANGNRRGADAARLNRRAWLTAIGGAALCASVGVHAQRAARTAVPRRLVVLDWGLAELLLSIGVVPVGMANTPGFRRSFVASPVPGSVVDLGLMFQPNMELMLALKPDLILITPEHRSLVASLERIAPTLTAAAFRTSSAPYTTACDETLRIARRLDRAAIGETTVDAANRAIAACRERMAARSANGPAPIYVVRFLDAARLRVYGPHSLFGEILTRLGFANAWPDSARGAPYATVGFDALAAAPDATLISPLPLPPAAAAMMRGPIWRATPFAGEGRMIGVEAVPPEGGVVSGTVFARALADAWQRARAPLGAA